MAVTVSLNQEIPQESTSHLGKTFFWARKNWSPPRPPQKTATVIFHWQNSFPLCTFESELLPPSLLAAAGLFLLRRDVQIVWIAVNSWNKWSSWFLTVCDKCEFKKKQNSRKLLTDNVPNLPRSTFFQLCKNIGLKSHSCNSEEKLLHVFSYSGKHNTRGKMNAWG